MTMRLRYEGRCQLCALELAAGTVATYDRDSKTVTCVNCEPQEASIIAALPIDSRDLGTTIPVPLPKAPEISAGVAGASAQREFERRKAKRETGIRDAHPVLGGLILAVTDDPQSTRAWSIGAQGEQRLGRRLDALVRPGIRVLHDRRIPPTRANIDHIVVCPSGVFVIDAKKHKGRPTLRVEGLFRRRVRLIVGSRDSTTLVVGVIKQIDHVRAALEAAALGHVPVGHVPVSGMLCFVDGDWPLLGGDFTISDVRVLWPRKAADLIAKSGEIDVETAERVCRVLAAKFPSA